ncbi:MAG: hypothetical protein ABI051_09105 [Vicinamibacterales bacterium]
MRILKPLSLIFVLLLVASVAWAQTAVTAADITRLETTAADVSRQIAALKGTDPTLAGDLDRTLASLNDDITYLRVKLRREGSVSREDYLGVRDRLETLRTRAQGPNEKVSAQPVNGDGQTIGGTLPVGTALDVRLQTPLDSGTARLEQRFEGTTVVDYPDQGGVIIPAGSVVRGFVSSVRAAGKVDRRGSLTLSFDEIRIGSTSYRLRAAVTQAMDGKMGQDTARIGTGAVVGAIIGGILGGGKGALLGVLVGGGGTIAATDGTDVVLPAGTILRIRLDQALEIAASR